MRDMEDSCVSSHSGRRRRRSRRGPIFSTIWFSLLGVHWFILVGLVLILWRPHPLSTNDLLVGSCGGLLGLFYFWVAYAVYHRRQYIFDIAFVCAGLGLLAFPFGTGLSILLLSNLTARKHHFTK